MKSFVVFIAVCIVASWAGACAFLLGIYDIEGVSLSLPSTTEAFSTSTSILDGVFSSVAVVLALVAVLLQGRELRESTAAQREQADVLKKQLDHQQDISRMHLERSQAIANQLAEQQTTNKIMMLQAKQQYHSSEISRMDGILRKIEGKKDKSDLFNSCVQKKNEHISHLNKIKDLINEID